MSRAHTELREHTMSDYRNSGLIPGAVWWAGLLAALGITRALDYHLAHDPHCPDTILDQLDGSGNRAAREGVAENPNTPQHTLRRLAHDPNAEIRYILAAREDLAEEDYLALLYRASTSIIDRLYANPAVSTSVIQAAWPAWGRRSSLLNNPNCSPDILFAALDTTPYEQHHINLVAGHPNTPSRALKALYKRRGTEPQIVGSLARNPKCPPKILTAIYETDVFHRGHVLTNPNCPPALIEHTIEQCLAGNGEFYGDIRDIIARDMLDQATLRRLWNRWPKIGHEIAGRADCPNDIWEQAAAGEHRPGRRSAAGRLTNSTAQLNRFAEDEDQNVRCTAFSHHNASCALLYRAPLSDIVSLDIRSDQLEHLDEDTIERMIGLAHSWSGTLGELREAAALLDVTA